MRLREAYKNNSISQLYTMRKACQKLLDYYSGKDNFLAGCPLCSALDDAGSDYATVLCDGTSGETKKWLLCPWFVMEGCTCGEYTARNIPHAPGCMGLRINKPAGWCDIRVPQLTKWIKRLNRYIETRKRNARH